MFFYAETPEGNNGFRGQSVKRPYEGGGLIALFAKAFPFPIFPL